jgi:hypothetical protein
MGARRTTLVIMAKMALSDGVVTEDERNYLSSLLHDDETVEALLYDARSGSLRELLDTVDRYADRFFIAFRAAKMARADRALDVREEALYEDIVSSLEITDADQQLIEESVDLLSSALPIAPAPRLKELFRESSFMSEEF